MTFKTSYHNTFIFKILNLGVFQPVGDPQFSFAPQETNIHSPSYVTQIYKGFNLMHSKVRPVLTPCIHGAGKSLSFKIRNIRNLRTEYEKLNKKKIPFFHRNLRENSRDSRQLRAFPRNRIINSFSRVQNRRSIFKFVFKIFFFFCYLILMNLIVS